MQTISSFTETVAGKIIGWVTIGVLVLVPYFGVRGYMYNLVSSKSIWFMIVMELVAITTGIIFLLRNKSGRIVLNPMLIAGVVFLSVYLLATIIGVAPAVSFWSKAARVTGLFFLIHVFFTSCLIAVYARDGKWVKRLLGAVLYSGIAFSLLSWLGNDGFNWKLFSYTQGQGFTIGNTTFAGTFLILSFIMGLWYVWGIEWKKNPWWKKALPFVMLFNPIILNINLFNGKTSWAELFHNPMVLIGPARAAAVSIIAAAVLWIGYRLINNIKKQNIRRGAIGGSVTILVIIFIGAIVSFAQPTGLVRTEFEKLSGGGRPLVWTIAGTAIAERPLLGWGPDNFDKAFQKHFNNQLFLPQYNETWFDRAHNIFIDTLVDTGVLGLIAYLSLYGAALFAVWRVMKRSSESSKNVAVIVTIGLLVHLLDIQTAFDTVVSFIFLGTLFAVIAGYVGSQKDWKSFTVPRWGMVAAGVILIVVSGIGFHYTNVIRASNQANSDARAAGSSAKRLVQYKIMFDTPMDEQAVLWRTVSDLEQGIMKTPQTLSDPKTVAGYISEFMYFEDVFKAHLAQHPDDYRSYLTLADTMMFMKLLDQDQLDQAKIYLDQAEQLVPSNPMPYVMRSVIAVYQNKFKDAYANIAHAQAVVPGVPYFDDTAAWIAKQQKTFPELDFRIIERI